MILQRLARFEQTGKEGGRQTRSAAKPQYNVCKRHSTRERFRPGLRKAIRVETLLYFSFAADTFGSRKLVNTVQMPRGLQRRHITRGKTTKYTNTSKYEYSYLLRPQLRLFRTRAERRNSCREPVKTGVSKSVRSHPHSHAQPGQLPGTERFTAAGCSPRPHVPVSEEHATGSLRGVCKLVTRSGKEFPGTRTRNNECAAGTVR